MTKKLLGVFTTIVAALAVVGVAWASGDDGTSTSIMATSSTGATIEDSTVDSVDDPPTSTGATVDTSTSASVNSSTSTSVDDNGDDRDDRDDDSSTTSTSMASTTSTSTNGTTSTSIDDDDTSTTATTIDDNDRVAVPDGIITHTIPGVGTVTIEAFAGELFLTSVSAPGWNVEREKIEKDRIELEFTNDLDAEAEFEARIRDGRIEVRIEVDSN
jgi:hypothetical protein